MKKEAIFTEDPVGDTLLIDNPSFEIAPWNPQYDTDKGWGQRANTWILPEFDIMGYTTDWASAGTNSFFFKKNADMGVSCYEGEWWAIHQDMDLTDMNYLNFDVHIINNEGVPIGDIFNQQGIFVGVDLDENCARGQLYVISLHEGTNTWEIPSQHKRATNICLKIKMSPGCYNPTDDVILYFDNFKMSPQCNIADRDCSGVISLQEILDSIANIYGDTTYFSSGTFTSSNIGIYIAGYY